MREEREVREGIMLETHRLSTKFAEDQMADTRTCTALAHALSHSPQHKREREM